MPHKPTVVAASDARMALRELISSITGREDDFSEDLAYVLADLATMLAEKNAKYGNSALEPIGVFSKLPPIEGINLRLDDKLKRLRNQERDDEDAAKDLMGYLVLREIALLRQSRRVE